jgi:hypothetical protein
MRTLRNYHQAPSVRQILNWRLDRRGPRDMGLSLAAHRRESVGFSI